MKEKSSLFLFLLLSWCTCFAQEHNAILPKFRQDARATNNKLGSHDDLPNLSWNFAWNATQSDWDSTARNTFAYFPNGNLAEHIIEQYNGGFAFATRRTFAYDLQGSLAQLRYLYWDGSAWQQQFRETYSYDTLQNPLVYFQEQWNAPAAEWDTIFGGRQSYEYVFNNRIAEDLVDFWNDLTGTWNPWERRQYHWPDAQGWDSCTVYNAQGGNWQPSTRTVDAVWHDFDDNLRTTWREQAFSVQGWVDDFKHDCTYMGPHDDRACVEQRWNGASWDPTTKQSIFYDAQEHEIARENFFWAGVWEPVSGIQFAFTYDGQGNTLEVIQDNHSNGQPFVHAFRTVYPSFFVASPGPSLPVSNVTAYPNPCTDHLSFQVKLKQNGPVQIALYDLQGRLRMQTVTPARVGEDIALPISETLENGSYIYRLGTKEGEVSAKITVQR